MSLHQSIVFATGNPYKIREVAATLAPLNTGVTGLDALGHAIPEPVEDGRSFLCNALIKARAYAAATGRLVLAEDSGLCVDALGGAPGVLSARYAGVGGPREAADRANNDKLLAALRGVPEAKRTARFVCVMVLCDPRRTWAVSRGTIEGRIAHDPAGTGGFGYDPLFLLPDRGCTSAQLTAEQKNEISHRGQATRIMLGLLQRLTNAPDPTAGGARVITPPPRPGA